MDDERLARRKAVSDVLPKFLKSRKVNFRLFL